MQTPLTDGNRKENDAEHSWHIALMASTGEEPNTIEDVVEPYLIQLGFVSRTPKGRVCTKSAYEHLKIDYFKD